MYVYIKINFFYASLVLSPVSLLDGDCLFCCCFLIPIVLIITFITITTINPAVKITIFVM